MNRYRPRIEQLGERVLPALSSGFSAGVLMIASDVESDAISISHDGTNIQLNGAAISGDPTLTNTESIELIGGGGHDLIEIDERNGLFAPGAGPDDEITLRLDVTATMYDLILRARDSVDDHLELLSFGVDLNLDGDTDLTFAGGALPATLRVEGGGGNDFVASGSFADMTTLVGGDGNDTLTAGTGTNWLFGGIGNDSLVGGISEDHLFGDVGDDTVSSAVSDNGDDSLTGGEGNDTLRGPISGFGRYVIVETTSGGLTLTDSQLLGAGTDVVSSISEAYLSGGAGDNVLDATSFSGSTTLIGAEGNDELRGGLGPDSLVGGTGADSLVGGPDNDTLTGDAGNDTLDGGMGNADVLFESSETNVTLSNTATVTDTRLTGQGTDLLRGIQKVQISLIAPAAPSPQPSPTRGEGSVTTATNGFTGGPSVVAATFKGVLFVFGSTVADSIVGGAGSDVLLGGNGSDTIVGGNGNDAINGGNDQDSIQGNAGNDTLTGGPGNDTLIGGTGTDRLIESANGNLAISNGTFSGLGTDVLSSIDEARITGGSGNNQINATPFSGRVTIDGGGGNDTLIGGGNHDSLFGGDGNDSLIGGNGNDTLNGGNGTDTGLGGGGTDSFLGVESATQ